jgi:hypothetical protein
MYLVSAKGQHSSQTMTKKGAIYTFYIGYVGKSNFEGQDCSVFLETDDQDRIIKYQFNYPDICLMRPLW